MQIIFLIISDGIFAEEEIQCCAVISKILNMAFVCATIQKVATIDTSVRSILKQC